MPRIARYQPGAVSFDRGRVRSRSATAVDTRYPLLLARRRDCRCAARGARTTGAARGALLLVDPSVESRRLDHVRVLAHGGVAEAAELSADDVVGAEPRRRDPDVRGEPRDGIGLEPERRNPEV